MSDLVAFTRARLGEEECGARFMIDREARLEVPRTDWLGVPFGERVLREVEAMRAIVDAYEPVAHNDGEHEPEYAYGWAEGLGMAVRSLAGIWRDHPDYDPGWAP